MTSMHTPIKTRAKARVAPASKASNPGRDKAPPKASMRPRAEPAPKDAIAMLRADHDAVSRLFAEHDRTRSRADRQALVAEICRSLSVHAQIEEEIFYPAVRAALKDATLLPEATVEHDGMKALIAQMQVETPEGAMFDAQVKVLSEYVRHHVKEEQTRMFPQVRASAVDLIALASRLRERQAELMALAH